MWLAREELVFDLARALTQGERGPTSMRGADARFVSTTDQLTVIVRHYLREDVLSPTSKICFWLRTMALWLVGGDPDRAHPPRYIAGQTPEVPRYEASRGPGSTAQVDYWTSREPREVVHSHVNYLVPDTQRWEQSAAYFIDTHSAVDAFVKNAGLGLAIPYLYNGQMHDYMPDFIVRLKMNRPVHLILETKGFDEREQEARCSRTVGRSS